MMMTNGLPRGMASFYHVGVVGGRDDNDGKRAAEGDGIILSSGLWVVVRCLVGIAIFDRCVGCLVDAASPRTSREPVFFSDVSLEDEVLRAMLLVQAGRY